MQATTFVIMALLEGMVDTHTHMYVHQFDGDRAEMVQRSKEAGVSRCYLPNIDRESIAPMLALEAAAPNYCYAMMGVHPCSINGEWKEELAIAEEWLGKRKWCAIGEIGMDLYWDKSWVKEQEQAFEIQVEWARQLQLPFSIHARESLDELIGILRRLQDGTLQFIFHCFTGSLDQAQAILELGGYLGIGGVVTYKNGGLDRVLDQVPLDRLVLETDAPYLAPVPYRGKRNEPAYLEVIAKRVAELQGIDQQTVVKVTTSNALDIFGI